MKIQTNISVVTERLKEKLKILSDREYLLRPVCFDMIDLMTKRIHVDGNASDESPIGNYSKGYMALRTGSFKNADKFSKGKQKGQNKNAGTFTDKVIRLNKQNGVFSGDEKTGTARPQFRRSSDTKVIISLTRQLENDWSVIATPNGGYGIGFLNPFNFQKARWSEATYKKKIFNLSGTETKTAIELIRELTRKALQ